jgi:hypothetical protein
MSMAKRSAKRTDDKKDTDFLNVFSYIFKTTEANHKKDVRSEYVAPSYLLVLTALYRGDGKYWGGLAAGTTVRQGRKYQRKSRGTILL